MSLDYQLFELINQFAGRKSLIDQLVILFSKYGPLLFGFVFVWLWFSKAGKRTKNRKLVMFAITIAVITLGVDKLIEMMYFRPRPFVTHDVMLLAQKLPELEVVIAGDGPMRPELESFVKKNKLVDVVSFIGFVDEADKPTLLNSANVACFPAMFGEFFGIVIVEAMDAGSGGMFAGDNPG